MFLLIIYVLVTLFARKTGDLANLSSVDLSLIALTYQLCKENFSQEEFNQLRTEPPKNIQPLINANELKLGKPVNIAGFYLPPKTNKANDNEDKDKNESNDQNEQEELSVNLENNLKLNDENNNDKIVEQNVDDDDGDDGEGWITPSNLTEIQRQSIVEGDKQEINDLKLKVGCMTSDFSMQVLVFHLNRLI